MVFVSALLPTLQESVGQSQAKQQQQNEKFLRTAFPPQRQYEGRTDDLDRVRILRSACQQGYDLLSRGEGGDNDDRDQSELIASISQRIKQYVAVLQQLIDLDRRASRANETLLKQELACAVWLVAAFQANEARIAVAELVKGETTTMSLAESKKQQACWNTAIKHLQYSACVVDYLQTQIMIGCRVTKRDNKNLLVPASFLDKDFLEYWQCLLLADGQYAAYQCFACTPTPKHFMVAKFAVAASSLYEEASEVDLNGDNDQDYLIDIARSLQMYWTSRAEYHQSITCKETKPKPKYSQEAARLESALKYATLCQQYCNNSSDGSGSSNPVTSVVSELLERSTLEIQQALINVQSDPCDASELQEIRPQKTVKFSASDIKKILLDKDKQPELAIVVAVANNAVTTVAVRTPARPAVRPSPTARKPAAATVTPASGSSPPAANTGSRITTISADQYDKRRQQKRRPQVRKVDSSDNYWGSDDDDDNNDESIDDARGNASDSSSSSSSRQPQHQIQQIQNQMKEQYDQVSSLAREKTEAARQTLSTVNLPHSLTNYKQQQQAKSMADGSTAGIPIDLWNQIETLQRDHVVETIQNGLWELRDLADVAKTVYDQIDSLLREDVQMDTLFREHHGPEFKGHDVEQVQQSFKKALDNYQKLMTAANESDQLLIEKCQRMETDTKFKLLKFRNKSQLDNLLIQQQQQSQRDNNGDSSEEDDETIDVTALSKYLVDLSALFDEREQLLKRLESSIESLDDNDTDGDRERASTSIGNAKRTQFDSIIARVHKSIEQQKELLVAILKENESFMNARAETMAQSTSNNHQDNNCIMKIQDSLEEVEQFQKHLVEGRAFYDVILPKLTKLQHQVGDVSARLTIERCEYEDKQKRNRQEEEDARMAANLAEENSRSSSHAPAAATADDDSDHNSSEEDDHLGAVPSSASLGESIDHLGEGSDHFDRLSEEREILRGSSTGASSSAMRHQHEEPQYPPHHHPLRPPSQHPNYHHNNHNRGGVGQPGFEQVSHDVPAVRVDDEKVASLVAMDFDPEQVVQALRKYDNDVERALNDLLGG